MLHNTSDVHDTKQALMEAAGELFALSGYDGTSIRSIAEKARANIAAVNYHFGSKENLYTEVLWFVTERSRGPQSPTVFLNDPRLDTPEGLAEIITEIVYNKFETYFNTDDPEWQSHLIMRSLLFPTPSLQKVVRKIFQPELDALKQILKRVRPDMGDREAALLGFSLFGQVTFYVFGQAPILMLLEKDAYDEAFLQEASAHVTKVMLTALGLPTPG